LVSLVFFRLISDDSLKIAKGFDKIGDIHCFLYQRKNNEILIIDPSRSKKDFKENVKKLKEKQMGYQRLLKRFLIGVQPEVDFKVKMKENISFYVNKDGSLYIFEEDWYKTNDELMGKIVDLIFDYDWTGNFRATVKEFGKILPNFKTKEEYAEKDSKFFNAYDIFEENNKFIVKISKYPIEDLKSFVEKMEKTLNNNKEKTFWLYVMEKFKKNKK
jgi:hypothetical protein